MTRFHRILMIGLIGLAAHGSIALSDTLSAVEQRVKPVGEVTVDPASVATATTATKPAATKRTGEAIYNTYCKTCHMTGLAGAPKFGDKGAWGPRIAKGTNMLFEHAIKGLNAMPPKGTCVDCTDDEIKDTVNYLVSHSK